MLAKNLRLAVQRLFKRPLVTVVAVLCLALGIGGATVVFSLVEAVLLESLPYQNPDRLALVFGRFTQQDVDQATLMPREFLDFQEQNPVFEAWSAGVPWYYNLTGIETPERLTGIQVAAGYFQALGVDPARGRAFAEREVDTLAPVVVLSHDLWQRRFGADPAIVGRTISLDDSPYEVIGVLPADYQPLVLGADLWLPMDPIALPQGQRRVILFGRLPGSGTVEAVRGGAQQALDLLATRWEEEFPDDYEPGSGWGLDLWPVQEYFIEDLRTPYLLLLGATILVLLIACANVANILLAQGASRAKEMALRCALGASRGQIVGQLLVESVVLAFAGGLLGIFAAWLGVGAVRGIELGDVPRIERVAVDGEILLFALLVSIATGVLFGLAPALQALRVDLQDALKEGGKTSEASGRGRLRHALVVVEVALAVVVLIGAGLVMRSLTALERVDPGFDTEDVLTAQLFLSFKTYPGGAERVGFYYRLLPRLQELPGVEKAAIISHLPLGPLDFRGPAIVEGREPPPPIVGWRIASPGYFDAMDIPIVAGRDFRDSDDFQSAGVVIIDDALAKRLWPDQNPIGQKLQVPLGPPPLGAFREVIGVVGNVRHQGLQTDTDQQLYLPYLQFAFPVIGLAIESAADPSTLRRALIDAMREIDPSQPVARIMTTGELVESSLSRTRFYRTLLTIFGAVSLLLALIGIYGVMSYGVAERRREFGLRIALGAGRGALFALVLRRGVLLALIGILVGGGAAYLFLDVLEERLAGILYGVEASDLPTFLAGIIVMLLVVLVANLLPAWRATRTDPLEVLREE